MTLRATLEPTRDSAEQRGTERKTLRLLTSVKRSSRKGTQVLVQDVSSGGILVESDESLAIGETLAVELPRSGVHEAVVVWTSGRFFGCRFAEPLSSAAVSAALLKALPVSAQTPQSAPVQNDFPTRLASLREARGLSMEQLAERLSVSRQAVWYWETGHRLPRSAMLKRIAKQLNIGENDLSEALPASKPKGGDNLATWKQEIAAQFGVSPGQVKILVEL